MQMQVRFVSRYCYFNCMDSNQLTLESGGEREIARFLFPRDTFIFALAANSSFLQSLANIYESM